MASELLTNLPLEDLIERCRTLEAIIKNQEKLVANGVLVAGVSHELKNPLNFVKNFSRSSAELIHELKICLKEKIPSLEDSCDDSIKNIADIILTLEQNAQYITNHTDRATKIISTMLSATRGGIKEFKKADINKTIDLYAMLSYHALRAQDMTFNIAFKKKYDGHLPLVDLLEDEFGRAIINVVDNCYQALYEFKKTSPDLKPEITLETTQQGNNVRIAIKDNGPGIKEEDLEKIFAPFYSTKAIGHGTGLGLPIVKEVVENQHTGKVTVHSVCGEGAEFIFVIPFVQEKNKS